MMNTNVMRRELETMPFAKAFETENGNEELCNATGLEVCFDGDDPSKLENWWNEYRDVDGNLYYGR